MESHRKPWNIIEYETESHGRSWNVTEDARRCQNIPTKRGNFFDYRFLLGWLATPTLC
jgi:hypothetical protein